MKNKMLFSAMLLVACLFSISIRATVNRNEAYRIIEGNVNESNNEIWLSNQPFSKGDTIYMWNGVLICPYEEAWAVFIDNQPLRNWGHECQYIFINSLNGEYKQFSRTSPPDEISEKWTKYRSIYPVTTKDTAGTKSYLNHLRQMFYTQASKQKSFGTRQEDSNLYAIIIDYCGSYPEYNHERLWNDCSAMYTTLLNNGYPKDHIYVVMPDSSFMLHLETGGFIPFPTDLDGDVINDVRYNATTSEVDRLFYDLSDVLTEDDILLVYLTGHGNFVQDGTFTYFGHLINGIYTDDTLVHKICSLNMGILNIIVQRSYTYYLNLSSLNDNSLFQTVISCDHIDETDFNLDSLLIDQYTYHWTTAVNGESMSNADLNADGYISMYEAHDYAVTNNSNAGASYRPHQNSTPVCLRHALTLTGTISNDPCVSSNIFIKDNGSDFGIEPNTSTDMFYISPDIWIEDLSGNVVNTLMSNEQYNICVRVHNMGSESSNGDETLHVHWTKAVIGGQWPDSWIDGSVYDCNGTMVYPGGEITPIEGWMLPSIPAGGEYIARVPWTTPNNADYAVCSEFANNLTELWHYCLLARLYEGDDTPGADLTYQPINEFILNSNNVASRNITIMNDIEGGNTAAQVGLVVPYHGIFSLQCRLYMNYDDFLSNNFAINISIDDNIRSGWSGNGFGFVDLGDIIQLTAPIAELQQIDLYDGVMYSIQVEVENGSSYDYIIDIELTDTNGIVVGGERFQSTPGVSTLNRAISTKKTDIENDTQPNITEQSLNEIKRVLVINAIGQVVEQAIDPSAIDLKKLPRGIYTIIVEEKDETKKYKIIR